jgi:serum/glucocorticoid-regulated kinase 2
MPGFFGKLKERFSKKRDVVVPPPRKQTTGDNDLDHLTSLGKPQEFLDTEGQEDVFGEGKVYDKKLSVKDFDLLKVVGKGSFGKVMQVRKKDSGKIYALKVLKKDQLVKRKQVAHTKTERKVLQEISHPFIVSLRFAFQNETKLYMVLDYFTGGELFFHLKSNGRFGEDQAKFYAAEITLALGELHRNTIVYRDLKPENVLLDDEGHVRITDFGLSKDGVTTTNLTNTFCGTPEYLAPEVIRGSGYGHPVDWWSLGTLTYEMLTGLPPFFNENLHVMYEKIIRGKLAFPSYISSGAKAFLKATLERDPAKRCGSNGGVDEIKAHPWFSDIDWEKLAAKKVDPPFKPTVEEGKMTTNNVDDEFLSEMPKDSFVAPNTLTQKAGAFADFTFRGAESPMTREDAGLS